MTFCSYSLKVQDTKDHKLPQLQLYFNIFNDQLSKPQQAHFQSWILGNLHGQVYGSKVAKSHSNKNATSVTRFLSQGTWDEQALNKQRIHQSLQIVDQYHGKYIPLIIDDSLCEKYGKKLPGAGYHWDHTNNTTTWGQHLVTSHMLLGTVDIPLFVDIYLKEDQFDDKNEFQSKLQLAQKQIEQFPKFNDKTGVVIGDSWYGSKDVINRVLEQEYQGIFAIKRNRKIKLRDGEHLKVGKKIEVLNEIEAHLVTVEQNMYRVWRYSVHLSGIERDWVSVLICQKLQFQEDNDDNEVSKWSDHMILMSTDEKMSDHLILKLYEKRWKIEVFYKFSKGCLGLGKSQSRGIRTLLRFLILLFFSYTFLALSRFGNSSLFIPSKSYYDAQSKVIDGCLDQMIIWVYVQATLGIPMDQIRLQLGFIQKSA